MLGYVSLWLDPADYGAFAQNQQTEWPLPENLQTAVPKRQALYLAGRYCAHEALKQAGCDPVPEIGTGPVGEPLWPLGWAGSISHSQTHVSAAVAPSHSYRGLGLDNETPMSEKTLKAIKDKISTPHERLQQPTSLSEVDYFTLLFSAKESLYKALYPTVQQFFDFQAAELRAVKAGRFEMVLLTSLHRDLPAGKRFQLYYHCEKSQIYTAILWQTAE